MYRKKNKVFVRGGVGLVFEIEFQFQLVLSLVLGVGAKRISGAGFYAYA